MGGMIRNPLSSGEQIREIPSLKNDHDWSCCQEFQLIRVFGTHSGEKRLNLLDAVEEVEWVLGDVADVGHMAKIERRNGARRVHTPDQA